ncbi:MAG: shikimate dehydrogenase [Pseudomonadota bacterium]|nr:shikimate dehydrogenase [Pseudomonadota bacterium]
MITGRTRVFGLVGHPVRHSLSPAMHNELFRRKRIDAIYVAFDVPPGRAGSVADAVRTLALAGVNLTVPFKERVLPGLDSLSESARLAGAANVVLREEGALVGHNTDGEGYVRALIEEMGMHPRGRRAAILGAGGTGRAVAAALAAQGASEIHLLNRTQARAEAACAALATTFPGTRFTAGPLTPAAFAACAPALDLVVNCTSGEAVPAVSALDIRGLARGTVWTDANYWMAEPPQLVACAAHGVRIQRGIGMLMHQGALSFALFTAMDVDTDTIRGVLDIGGW